MRRYLYKYTSKVAPKEREERYALYGYIYRYINKKRVMEILSTTQVVPSRIELLFRE